MNSPAADDQGGTLGVGQSAAALGRVLGPATATHAYARWYAAPYLGGALVMLATAAVGTSLRRPAAAAEETAEAAAARGR